MCSSLGLAITRRPPWPPPTQAFEEIWSEKQPDITTKINYPWATVDALKEKGMMDRKVMTMWYALFLLPRAHECSLVLYIKLHFLISVPHLQNTVVLEGRGAKGETFIYFNGFAGFLPFPKLFGHQRQSIGVFRKKAWLSGSCRFTLEQ